MDLDTEEGCLSEDKEPVVMQEPEKVEGKQLVSDESQRKLREEDGKD